jgi:GH24 family phage-related lysozyme (muramidase)
MDADVFFAYLRGDEGFKPKPYLDSKGHPTVATGFNLDRADARAKIAQVAPDVNFDELYRLRAELTADQAVALDMIVAKEQVAIVRRLFPNFDSLPPVVQIIVTDMSYMGEGTFSKFTTFIRMIEVGDYAGAARDLVHTPWYTEVGLRGPRTARGLASLQLWKHDGSGFMDVQPAAIPAPVTAVRLPAENVIKPDLKALAQAAFEAVQRLRDAIEG